MLTLLFLVVTIFSQTSLVKYNTTIQRYKSVIFPLTGSYFLPNTSRNERFLISPKFPYRAGMDKVDFCLDIASLIPELPLNDTNFCKNYFCSASKPPLYQNISNPFIFGYDSQILKKDPRTKHLLIQQYCLKCESTYDQRFDLYIQNNTCRWLEVDYCQKNCQGYNDCFMMMPTIYVCYSAQRNQFLHGETSLINLGILRLYGVSYLGFIVGILLLIFNLSILVLPEIHHFFIIRNSEERKTLNFFQKCKHFFGLRIQVIFWNIVISIGFILTGFIDIINFSSVVFTTIMLLISIALEVYIWVLIIILWLDVIQKAANFTQEYSELPIYLKVLWILISIVTLVISATGALIYILTIVFRDNDLRSSILNIILFILISIVLVVLIIASLVLWILSIYLFFKIQSVDIQNVQELTKVTSHYFKVNLTRNIIVLNLLVVPTFLVCFFLGLSAINYEIITLYGLFLCHFLGTCLTLILSFWIGITMANTNYLKEFYFGCCKAKMECELKD